MNVLHVIDSMDPVNGGPCQGIRSLEKATRNNGVIREVLCLDTLGSSYLGNDNFKIHPLGPGIGPWHYQPALSSWLEANLSNFEIIIINGLWLYHSYVAWKVVNKVKKNAIGKIPRVLVMPNGMLDPYFQKAKKRRLKAIRNWFYWKLIERKVVNDADGLLFTCEAELLLARQTFRPYHPKKEYNVGYGIAPPPEFDVKMEDAFRLTCFGVQGDYLLFLSRIHPKKGLDLLVEAYIGLYKSAPDSAIRLPELVIAGPGLDTRFGQSLQHRLSKYPDVKSKIFFTGMLTGDAKWGAFYGCEAFVLPSHQENFGIAIVEALACGKPVLISNQINIWREIASGGAGIIEDDNLEGVKNLLNKWIKLQGQERIKMGANAVEVFQKCFDVNKVVQKYISVFNDLS